MRKIINYLTALFGILLILNGILKSFDMIESIGFYVGEMYLTIPNKNSFIYIFIVNFIGGLAFLHHSMSTRKFKKKYLFPEQTDTKDSVTLKAMNRSTLISGLITLVISSWLIIRTTIILSSFDGQVQYLLPLFILAFSVLTFYAIIPITLATLNLTLNSKIEAILEIERKQEKYKASRQK